MCCRGQFCARRHPRGTGRAEARRHSVEHRRSAADDGQLPESVLQHEPEHLAGSLQCRRQYDLRRGEDGGADGCEHVRRPRAVRLRLRIQWEEGGLSGLFGLRPDFHQQADNGVQGLQGRRRSRAGARPALQRRRLCADRECAGFHAGSAAGGGIGAGVRARGVQQLSDGIPAEAGGQHGDVLRDRLHVSER